MEALDGKAPFTMIADGRASLFVPSGLKDGPLPTHYEPVESPVKNSFYKERRIKHLTEWSRGWKGSAAATVGRLRANKSYLYQDRR